MNYELLIAVRRIFKTQTEATKKLGVDEPRLSRLIHGHRAPTAEERRRFAATFGVDYFAPDGDPVRAENRAG